MVPSAVSKIPDRASTELASIETSREIFVPKIESPKRPKKKLDLPTSYAF